MKLLFTLLFVIIASLQSADCQELKWGNIPSKDLKMTIYTADTSASAVILNDKGKIRLDFSETQPECIFTRHTRVKILNKIGLEEGDISIPYFDKYHRVRDFEAQTILPNGQIFKINKKDIFEETLDNGWKLKKIAATNLEVGAVIEYRYTFYSKNITTLRDWYFQRDIPTRHSEFEVYIQDWLNYIYLVDNPELLTVNESKTIIEDIVNFKKVGVNYRRFVGEHLPAIKPEAFVTDLDNHKMRIRFQLFEYAPPSGGYYKYLEDWLTTAKDLMDDVDLGRQFTKKGASKNLRKKAEELTQTATTEREKLDIISKFIHNNITWNERYRLYAENKLDDCLKLGKANSSELNMTALAMLDALNIPAYPILLSTRSHGNPIVDYPIINQFNHLIALVEIDKKNTLIDLTNPFRPTGYVGVESLNKKGLLIKNNVPEWVAITPPDSKDIIAANLTLTNEGQLIGEVKTRCTGYSAVNERQKIANDPEGDFWLKRINEQFAEASIDDMVFKKIAAIDQPISNVFKLEIEDAAQVVGDFIYLSPIIYSNFSENPFKLETRAYPVEIPYPFQQQIVMNIKIPEGYQVEELPEKANMVLPNDGGQLQFSIDEKEGSIQLNSRFVVKQLNFSPAEYPNLKLFFDLFIEKHGEQIVLKKS